MLPDGCCDVLVVSKDEAEGEVVCFTRWDTSPRMVKIPAGTSITGYRLRPGSVVAVADFAVDGFEPATLSQRMESMVRQDHESSELIEAFGNLNETVDSLARQQGVSARTLQRHFRSLSLPPPGFWRLLGRARRAVQALASPMPLSEIAFAYGYSDQPHMTREFVRWFGMTPLQICRSPATLRELSQPGLGNWSKSSASEVAGL